MKFDQNPAVFAILKKKKNNIYCWDIFQINSILDEIKML